MSGAILVGGCLCGAVRYEIDGAADNISNCHCGMCRKALSAAFVTWIGVAHERLRYTQGVPASYRSSDIASRSFCGTCGSQLQIDDHGAHDHTHVTLGSLDEPGRLTPQRHIWMSDRLP